MECCNRLNRSVKGALLWGLSAMLSVLGFLEAVVAVVTHSVGYGVFAAVLFGLCIFFWNVAEDYVKETKKLARNQNQY